jgi:hypothetical protein
MRKVPLYENLIRQALAAREKAEALQRDSVRVRNLAQLLRKADAGELLLLHCAWCGKLRVGEEWLELEALGNGQVRIAQSLVRKSSHGICPSCFAEVNASVEAERAKER